MHSIFSPDSRFMIAANRAADLMILNLMLLLTSLPIVTIGPAMTALYRVVFAMGTHREESALRTYLRAFRDNFRQALKLWLLMLAVIAALLLDVYLFAQLPNVLSYGSILFVILTLVALLGSVYVFPLVSFFENTTLGTVKNALLLGLGNLPLSILLLAIQAFPAILLLVRPLLFFQTAFLWVVIYFSAAAYLSSLMLRRVLAPYLPENEFKEESE